MPDEPKKVVEVTNQIQGLNASRALDVLRIIPRKSARLVEKTLKSAIANATNNANLSAETLRVKVAAANEGTRMKRFQPKARGSAGPILKRMSHIRIVLTDGQ